MPKVRHQPTEWRPREAWRPIISEVMARYDLCEKDVKAGWKNARYVRCRHEIWWNIRKRLGISLNQIGRRLGGYHHTSVRHGVLLWEEGLAGRTTIRFRVTH